MFIEVTNRSGNKIFVNINYIIEVNLVQDNITRLVTTDCHDGWEVKGSYEEVKVLINNEQCIDQGNKRFLQGGVI